MTTPLWIEKLRAKLDCSDQVDPLAPVVPEHIGITVLSRRGRAVGRWRHKLDGGKLHVRAALGGMPAVAKRDGAEAWAYSTAPDWNDSTARALGLADEIDWPPAYTGLHDLEEVIVVVDEVPRQQTRRVRGSSAKQTRRRNICEAN